MQTGVIYCFGDFEIQTDEHRLLVGGAPIALGARAFNLLLALAERAGQLVTKDALLERVWPDVVVEENNLQVQISTLRKLLGQGAIVTVVGKGYRFTPEIILKAPTVARAQQHSLHAHSNLPHHLGALIGREEALAHLDLLLGQERLVTITGPGGVGKTRLMIACATAQLKHFPDGVRMVELANTTDPQLAAATVAVTLGIEVNDASTAAEALTRHMRDKKMLLLFDNCEHLVEAMALLVDKLLVGAPDLHILTTSQDVLGINGEQVFRVPSLTLPADESPNAIDALKCGAVKLFAERAKLGDMSFRCDDTNAPVIAVICRRLDGIPLAIEMAAARVATLGLPSVAQLLDQRFLALTAGRRSAVPRQRTLQATLDWSFALLDLPERIVFRRLAAFIGGFTLSAGVAAASDHDLDQNQAIDAISILVSKSLLAVDTTQGQWRYRLLETARAYGQEKLAEAQEPDAVAQRTAAHFLWAFQSCFDDWTRLSDAEFDACYMPDLDNLRSCLDWAFSEHGEPQIGLILIGLSSPLWVGRLMIKEAERRLEVARSHVDAQTPPLIKARLDLAAGHFFYSRLNEQATEPLSEAAPVFQAEGDHARAGFALCMLGGAYAAVGDSRGEAVLAQARIAVKLADRPHLSAILPKSCAVLYYMRGQVAETIRENIDAIERSRAGGYEILALILEENLADSLWLAGDLPKALIAARNVVEACKRVKVSHKINWGWIYGNLFGILTESGLLAEATEVGCVAMPYIYEARTTRILMDHYALRLAKTGNMREAALVLGWINAQFKNRNIVRQPNELRANTSTVEILNAHLPADVLAEHCSTGAKMREQDVCALALS